jgi:hypothetical protein
MTAQQWRLLQHRSTTETQPQLQMVNETGSGSPSGLHHVEPLEGDVLVLSTQADLFAGNQRRRLVSNDRALNTYASSISLNINTFHSKNTSDDNIFT